MKEKKEFKKIYKEEFEDPNEAFQEFLLSLIPKETLLSIILKGNTYYYKKINKYL